MKQDDGISWGPVSTSYLSFGLFNQYIISIRTEPGFSNDGGTQCTFQITKACKLNNHFLIDTCKFNKTSIRNFSIADLVVRNVGTYISPYLPPGGSPYNFEFFWEVLEDKDYINFDCSGPNPSLFNVSFDCWIRIKFIVKSFIY